MCSPINDEADELSNSVEDLNLTFRLFSGWRTAPS